jgi:hypothetical protein
MLSIRQKNGNANSFCLKTSSSRPRSIYNATQMSADEQLTKERFDRTAKNP